jgi:hypothetical protein
MKGLTFEIRGDLEINLEAKIKGGAPYVALQLLPGPDGVVEELRVDLTEADARRLAEDLVAVALWAVLEAQRVESEGGG